MPLRAWLKPPRSLLFVLFLLTLVAVCSLIWFGWRLLQQEQAVAQEHLQERLERGADRVVASMRGVLAEDRERLSAWATTPPPEGQPEQGLLLQGKENPVSAFPQGRLLYWPLPFPVEQVLPGAFAQGERLEFVEHQEEGAADLYRGLADSHASTTIRAGALMRLGRVLRKLGRKKEAAAAYARLATFSGTRVADVPADLVGRLEISELQGRAASAEKLQNDLLLGRWQLSRGQFQFYWSEAVRLAGHDEPLPSTSLALADAAASAWRKTENNPAARGERNLLIDGKSFLTIWQVNSQGRSLLVLPLDSLLDRVSHSEEVDWAIADIEGQLLEGQRNDAGRVVVRTAAEAQLPWTLYITGLRSPNDAGLKAEKRFVLAAGAIMVLCVLAGSYFIARAIRSEMAFSQMQANFISAVSHEFRSPLTSIRQLSEILAEGRAASDRQPLYYETLVKEASRLQRLVETLLDFGRMEAGARRYQFQTMEAGELVRQVTAQFESQIAGSGRHIEIIGPLEHCAITADSEAMAVAFRNLVDNALKYSPNCPGVWLEWGRENGYVAIRVRDGGVGIQASEQRAIFKKFVRGSAALASQVKGTGVGLTIAHQIVLAHNGQIKLVSEPGQGSTFTVLLPPAEKI